MPRYARKASSTGIYHVMMRGINHEQLFEERNDYYHFLKCLQTAKEQYSPEGKPLPDICCYYAYALMGNHFHLLIHVKEGTIGPIIKQVADSYAMYFNKKYDRNGPLFNGRFRSEPCEDFAYFITLLRYIHQNPVKAGIVKNLSDYEFTSWREYLNRRTVYSVCNVQAVLHRIPMKDLRFQVELPLAEEICPLEEDEFLKKRISSQKLVDYLKEHYQITIGATLRKMEKEKRNRILKELLELGATYRQIQRLTGITGKVLAKLK